MDAADLFMQHAPTIRRYLISRVGPDDADDLLSDVFERVVRGLPTYEDRGWSARAWLYRIAHARIVDFLRYERRHPHKRIESWHAHIDGPEEAAVQRDHARWVRTQVFSHLRGDQFTVIWLRFIEEKPLEETAAILDTTVNAVKALQWRGLARLRLVIGPEDYTPMVVALAGSCSIPGCDRAIVRRGMCQNHYVRYMKHR